MILPANESALPTYLEALFLLCLKSVNVLIL